MGASESKLGFKQAVFKLAEQKNISLQDESWAEVRFAVLPSTLVYMARSSFGCEVFFMSWHEIQSLPLTILFLAVLAAS